MARPRSFEEGEVLQTALMLFWKHGYDGTTMRMLSDETDVGVRGLVNVFGDKEKLFARVLAAYHDMAKNVLANVFDPPGLDAIETLFRGMAAPVEADAINNSGCLMVNTVFNAGRAGTRFEPEIQSYREMFCNIFEVSLRTADVPESGARAEFLVASLWGILSHIRLSRSTEAAEPMVGVVIQTLRSWRI